jgi:hypothetical protein
MTLMRSIIGTLLAVGCASCANMPSPTQPTAIGVAPASAISFEAEDGAGDGDLKQRSRASGGRTIHLAPGQRRLWTFNFGASPTSFALSVTYSNGKEGDNEVLSVFVDGALITSFQDRDSGDAVEGWNTFITDAAGSSLLGGKSHTLVIESRGGDGCVEIDLVTLKPAAGV